MFEQIGLCQVDSGKQSPTTSPEDAPGVGWASAQALREWTSEEAAIDAVLAGDVAAFGILVERYQDRLFNALLHVTGSVEDAQDMAQEAFVQAFLKLPGFQKKATFFTWLYRIAFNRAVSHSRRRREKTSLDGLRETGVAEPIDRQTSPEAEMIANERSEWVHKAIAGLAEDHRRIVVLREMEGFDYQQIAQVLEIPIGTVRSRLFRARMQMKEFLTPLLAEESSESQSETI